MAKSEEIVFKEDDLSVGELEDFEDITGVPLDEAMANVKEGQIRINARTLKAIVYIIKRRDDPEFTIEQARDVKVSQLVFDQRPTLAERPGPKKRAAASPKPKRTARKK